ncbi:MULTISPECIES: phospho-N-acetylmuramoyl-pentapeptide-transferase [unclassified Imperialibacter]|uniref:phospho-N-acetylmuramoyl-pentapeptide- transferase n=1 Tax=unclassified Imperialibacter TaxID=2629706 RepID=UPI0012525D07|nr:MULTISPECIES: phospho-N-acetylmuramoyl-pentapeptide-transferase [unclassified Imperialibacter]CAD5284859.1 Phospho-N-acetylmuramoyl-pentapeptide-transferase [Imperialibacter sp. 75]CAD5296647.1 Phospho-N-acetylmuramoyl-pentapeptide-transferase [Imperialibacter sp. 89]VVT24265.1 Phospho-N-acetylmuramoyl-pentapeptide-transferase [Imperialibacter sp. EC-SDR9]
MLYYLFDYLESEFNLMGASVFRFISFRAGMAALISLLITVTFGKYLIGMLHKYQLGEEIRDLGLQGQMEKKGTPTMGGIIIIMAIVIPTLLFAQLENIYIILMLVTAISMGSIGFLDDYLKLKKKNKDGLAGKFKIIGQVSVGLLVGLVLVFNDDVTVREFTYKSVNGQIISSFNDVKALITTIPFIKDNELDYHVLFGLLGQFDWVLYVLLVVFIFTSVSNGANITDGVDGLAAGTSAIIALTLAIFAYVSGNVTFSQYLNVMFIPNSGELVIFCTALVGACIGFLWYNAYPAQVFMGDTGSLSLGGIIAVLAIIVRKELLIPFMCGIFVVENLSVVIQVSYFKYTKKKFGEGKRVFLMSPLHHHYQKKGIHEAKIVARFWTVGILLAIFSLVTLKLR